MKAEEIELLESKKLHMELFLKTLKSDSSIRIVEADIKDIEKMINNLKYN